jgi:hypothetical protein
MCGRCAAVASVAAIPVEKGDEEEEQGDDNKVLLLLFLEW